MVFAECLFTDRQRVVEQVGSFFVLILISVETGKVKHSVNIVFTRINIRNPTILASTLAFSKHLFLVPDETETI